MRLVTSPFYSEILKYCCKVDPALCWRFFYLHWIHYYYLTNQGLNCNVTSLQYLKLLLLANIGWILCIFK